MHFLFSFASVLMSECHELFEARPFTLACTVGRAAAFAVDAPVASQW